jgi:hypothetical protein
VKALATALAWLGVLGALLGFGRAYQDYDASQSEARSWVGIPAVVADVEAPDAGSRDYPFYTFEVRLRDGGDASVVADLGHDPRDPDAYAGRGVMVWSSPRSPSMFFPRPGAESVVDLGANLLWMGLVWAGLASLLGFGARRWLAARRGSSGGPQVACERGAGSTGYGGPFLR